MPNRRVVAEITSINEQIAGYIPNDVYMAVRIRMMSTAPNRNGDVIERSFIDGIVNNASFYNGTPVKVDIGSLLTYERLGHRYDQATREWHTDQIGSIVSFEAVEEEGEYVLYGIARIEKARQEVSAAILELYEMGALKFSFEIMAADLRIENGLTYIGFSENNYLTAMCIVSVPAYADAEAVALVAEMENEPMNDEEKKVIQPEEQAAPEAEQVEAEVTTVEELTQGQPEPAPEAEPTPEKKIEETTQEDDESSQPAPDPEPEPDPKDSGDGTKSIKTAPALVQEPEQPEEDGDKTDPVQAELEELRAFKAQVEAERREAEAEGKREKLRVFAERIGLDAAAYAQQIHDLDYEAICMAELPAEPVQAEVNEPEEDKNVRGIPMEEPKMNDAEGARPKWEGFVTDPTGLDE